MNMSEVYSFVNCSGYQSSVKINRSILWESIVYIEFIIECIHILSLFVNCVLHNKIYDKLMYVSDAHMVFWVSFFSIFFFNIYQHYVILLSSRCLQDMDSFLSRLRAFCSFRLFFFFSFICPFFPISENKKGGLWTGQIGKNLSYLAKDCNHFNIVCFFSLYFCRMRIFGLVLLSWQGAYTQLCLL